MFSSISISALFYILQIVAVRGAKHPAFKRQTFQDLCGASGVDCGNGWCCMVGQECVDADPEPLCADNILTEFGGYIRNLFLSTPTKISLSTTQSSSNMI
jgi:hypothetical protein